MTVECNRKKDSRVVSHYFLPMFFTPTWINPKPIKSALPMVPSSLSWAPQREETGGRNPTNRGYGDLMTFQSFSSPKGPPSFGCSRHTCGGLAPSMDTVLSPKGTNITGPTGAHLRAHCCHLLGTKDSPVGGPRLLRLQGVTAARVTKPYGEYRRELILLVKLVLIFFLSVVASQG